MAIHDYGLDRGEKDQSFVTEDSGSTTAKTLEVTLDDTAGWTKLEVERALANIVRHIFERGAQPLA